MKDGIYLIPAAPTDDEYAANGAFLTEKFQHLKDNAWHMSEGAIDQYLQHDIQNTRQWAERPHGFLDATGFKDDPQSSQHPFLPLRPRSLSARIASGGGDLVKGTLKTAFTAAAVGGLIAFSGYEFHHAMTYPLADIKNVFGAVNNLMIPAFGAVSSLALSSQVARFAWDGIKDSFSFAAHMTSKNTTGVTYYTGGRYRGPAQLMVTGARMKTAPATTRTITNPMDIGQLIPFASMP